MIVVQGQLRQKVLKTPSEPMAGRGGTCLSAPAMVESGPGLPRHKASCLISK
jgi:hypothetical protein